MSAAILKARPEAEPALREWIAAAGSLAAYASSHPAAVELHGRGTVHAIPSPPPGTGEWVVRHYHRGGALAPALGDRYLRAGTPRPVREYTLARALEELGVPTPRAVGAAVYPAGAFYRGDLVTERARAVDLAAVLFGAVSLPAAPRAAEPLPSETLGTGSRAHGVELGAPEAMAAAGRLIRRLHDAGLVHPDLNLKNVLITAVDGPQAMVLDLDRARLVGTVPPRARRRMLRRFWRSVAKWEDRTGRALGVEARGAFTASYEEGASPRPGAPELPGSGAQG